MYTYWDFCYVFRDHIKGGAKVILIGPNIYIEKKGRA